jgi:hypothetical protein
MGWYCDRGSDTIVFQGCNYKGRPILIFFSLMSLLTNQISFEKYLWVRKEDPFAGEKKSKLGCLYKSSKH